MSPAASSMEPSAEPAAVSAGESDAVPSGLPAMPTPASSVGPTRILLVEDELAGGGDGSAGGDAADGAGDDTADEPAEESTRSVS